MIIGKKFNHRKRKKLMIENLMLDKRLKESYETIGRNWDTASEKAKKRFIKRRLDYITTMVSGQYNNYKKNERLILVDVYDIEDSKNIIGFMELGYDPETISYEIFNGYIVSAYQKQGYMKKALADFITKNPGAYRTAGFTCKENEKVMEFYDRLFSQLGYAKVTPDSKAYLRMYIKEGLM